jgi:CelD/BcsL family acetyltransferase involved in cellulose biosynthesis
LRVDVVSPGELAAPEVARWTEIQAGDEALASPFLSPDFATAVGRARSSTRVAVLSDSTGVVGFLPFEVMRLGFGAALAKGLSDVQGLIVPREADVDLHQVVRACGLRTFDFDHLLAGQERWLTSGFSRYVHERSPAIDLSGGFDAYAGRQRDASRSLFQSTGRKRRKLEREHGPVRLVFDQRDQGVLDQVLRWKSDQYRRTGRVDRFADHANRALVHDLVENRRASFGAPLTVLLAGDKVVAGHLGLRSTTTLAWWFPVYDTAYAAYSPGLVLCVELIRAMTEQGLTMLDLGKGDELYKERLSNTHIALLRGSVARDRVTANLDRARRWPRDQVMKIVLESPRLRRRARATLARVGALRGVATRRSAVPTSDGGVGERPRHVE